MTASVNEGTSHTYSFTTTDPGADTFTLDATECGTGGTQVGADTFDPTTGAGSFVCSFPDGPATPTVSVTSATPTPPPDSDTLAVTVANVKPIDRADRVGAPPTRVTTNTYSFTVTDPGAGHAHDRRPAAAPTGPRSPGRTPTTPAPGWAASSASSLTGRRRRT